MSPKATLEYGCRLGPYEIRGFLGAGGMGEVFRARDTRLERDVALKVMSPRLARGPGDLRRFEREARTAGALNHPNVLAIHDIGTYDGAPYVVSELLEGRTLREHLREGLTVQKAIEITAQVARGLAAAHEKGIVHRDLKPANVFVTRDGRAKILDFGLAKLAQPEAETETSETARTYTHPGAFVGTVGYASPEQVSGRGADPRSDVFALGIVLYEMLARVPPFLGDTRVDTLAAILHADPPPLATRNPRVPAVVESLVRRSLEKSPEDRFQSARDFAYALESALSLVQSDDGTGSFRARLLWRGQWRRGLRYAAATLVLATVAGMGFMMKGIFGPPRTPLAEPRDLTPLQLTSEPGVESEPALSPDGTLVAYTVEGEGGTDIWLADVRGGPPLQLTDHVGGDRSPSWFPDGSALAFVSDRDEPPGIWSVPRLGGAPRRLLPEAFDPAVSPDGGTLAFARRERSGLPRIGVVTLGRPETARWVSAETDDLWGHWQPAWSPDGETLCFSDRFDLWLVSVATGEQRRLTRDRGGDASPVFSSDGSHVYFSSTRGATLALWRVRIDGRALQRLTFGTGPEDRPSLAATAPRLVYSTHSAEPDLVLADRQTGQRVRIAGPRGEELPLFLPDGSGIVFGSDRAGDWDLWIQPLADGRPAGAARHLTDQPGSEFHAAPSPDGRWIAYGRRVGEARDIWIVPAAGGTPRPLVEDLDHDLHPAWSPDGTRLAFVSSRGGEPDIWVASMRNGAVVGEPKALTRAESFDYYPSWSPDGSFLTFTRQEASRSEAWVVAVDGSADPYPVTDGAEARFSRWSRDGAALLVSGRWGGDAVEIQSVPVAGGPPRRIEPSIDMGVDEWAGPFAVSPDGRFLVFVEPLSRGDVWLLEARTGRF